MDMYSTMILLAVMTSLLLIISIVMNKNLNEQKRKGFLVVYILIMICTICEWLGVFLNGNTKVGYLKFFHILVKAVEIIITPMIPVICGVTVFATDTAKTFLNKYFLDNICILCAYIVIMLALIGNKAIFYVDNNNVYHHENYYHLYSIMFTSSAIYFFVKVFIFSRSQQNRNCITLFSIMAFIFIGVVIQFLNPSIKSCWLTISIAAMFIYIYYNEITQYVDSQTQLLNRRSYDNRLEKISDALILITFDVDDFKSVNTLYGHSEGDNVLKAVSNAIINVYSKYGNCYRIGGDEFAVIITDNADVELLNAKFLKKLSEMRKEYTILPYVSYGVFKYDKSSKETLNTEKAKKLADENLYINKDNEKKKRGIIN